MHLPELLDEDEYGELSNWRTYEEEPYDPTGFDLRHREYEQDYEHFYQ